MESCMTIIGYHFELLNIHIEMRVCFLVFKSILKALFLITLKAFSFGSQHR
jgi:hypothetical protein